MAEGREQDDPAYFECNRCPGQPEQEFEWHAPTTAGSATGPPPIVS